MAQPSRTAKHIVFHQTGPSEVQQIEEHTVRAPNKGEALLRVKAIGVNRGEVLYRQGGGYPATLPSTNGWEASGIVEEVGEDVDQGLVGQKRSILPSWMLGTFETYGELIVVPAWTLAEYPSHLSFEEATSIWMQYLTAYNGLVYIHKLKPQETVLITAGSSVIGLAAIQLVNATGAIPIVTTRTAKKKAQLLELGAKHVIVTEEEDLVARVNEITGGKGVDVCFDALVGPQFAKLVAATRDYGAIYVYGNLTAAPTTDLPPLLFMRKNLTIRGFTLYDLGRDQQGLQVAQEYTREHIKSGAFKPRVDKVFHGLAGIIDAHRYMESDAQIGKVVVSLSDEKQ